VWLTIELRGLKGCSCVGGGDCGPNDRPDWGPTGGCECMLFGGSDWVTAALGSLEERDPC